MRHTTVFFSQAGCLLPALILFNLFFGWVFLKPAQWLLSEAVLVLLFLVFSAISVRKIKKNFTSRPGAIDVEGEVVSDGEFKKGRHING